jgi:hypothetical protein
VRETEVEGQMSRENVATNKLRKGSLIGLLLFALLIGLWWGVPTYRKASADAMVKDLCAKDGGVKVYEIMKIPSERFSPYGNVIFPGNKNLPPIQKEVKSTDEFYVTSETTWLVPESGFGSLAIWRSHQKLFRAADHRLLGESISYSRRGGDPFGPWHSSSFGCPSDADIVYLVKKAFVKK